MEKEFMYIYNVEQGLFYLKNGLIPCDWGTGNRGDAFMKFKNNKEYKTLFKEWCLKNK